jgi:hypothetical protein
MGYASYADMAQGFGPGFDAPLIVAARVAPGDGARLDGLRGAIEVTPGVVAVTPPVISRDGQAAVLVAYRPPASRTRRPTRWSTGWRTGCCRGPG